MAMGLKIGVGLLPRLLADEKVLHVQPWVRAVSGKSWPSYRVSWSVPLIQEMGLYVTDRRVVLVCWLFRLLRLEWAAWFEVEEEGADQDQIQDVSVGRRSLGGDYLQITTRNPVRHWLRSPEARIRIGVKEPEVVGRLIRSALRPRTHGDG
jgi:hypothetical protein